MSKLDDAFQEVRRLPPDLQEKVAEDLLTYAHRWLALRSEIDRGMSDIEAGRVHSLGEIMQELDEAIARSRDVA
jgi:predicted transcriptional regulator